MKTKAASFIIAVIGLFSFFGCSQPSKPDYADQVSLTVYTFAWDWLRDWSIYQERLPADPCRYTTPQDLFAGMNDVTHGTSFTTYFTPEMTRLYEMYLFGGGSGVGLGLLIQSHGTAAQARYFIRFVVPNSPAATAGLLKFDTLVNINDSAITGMEWNAMRSLFGGPEGTVVRFTVKRPGFDSLRTFPVIRGPYTSPSVILDSLDPDIAYIWITGFDENISTHRGTTEELDSALTLSQSAAATIIDLRQDGGGFVTQCLKVCGQFMRQGDTLVKMKTRDVNAARTAVITVDTALISPATSRWLTRKFILLVDSGSASASEVMAAGIMSNRPDIPVMGGRTYGKAKGQIYAYGMDGNLFNLTTMLFLTKEGTAYADIGLTPTIVLADGTDWLDTAYAKAREMAGLPKPLSKSAYGPSPLDLCKLNRSLIGRTRFSPDFPVRKGAEARVPLF